MLSFKNKLLSASLFLSLLATPAYAKSWVETVNNTETNIRASVLKDDSVTMRTDTAFKEVRIANPDIADVVVMTNRKFQIMGKAGGKTNVMFYDDVGRLVDIVDVDVSYDIAALNLSLKEALPYTKINAKKMANGVYLSGTVNNENAAKQAVKIAQAYAPGRVTDGLKIGESHQVMLEVRFVEASRDAVKELGIGLITDRAGDFQAQTGAGLFSGNTPSLSGALFGNIGSTSLDASIEALEENGVIRTLAEPNLVSISGETASFLAGGEFPIPVAADDGQISIEFRQFGVGLAFTPTVRSDGVINLKVVPEVSQIDNTNSVRIAGVEIPSLRVRRANTSVELRNAQSFAIAGLLQNNASTDKAQIPIMGDLPILGSLFRSARYRNFETELVIIITPRLVQPVEDIAQLTTPHETTQMPSEADLFLNGTVEIDKQPVAKIDRFSTVPSKTPEKNAIKKMSSKVTEVTAEKHVNAAAITTLHPGPPSLKTVKEYTPRRHVLKQLASLDSAIKSDRSET